MYRVLLIDNDQEVNAANERYLKEHGFDVMTIADSCAALEQLSQEFDCIVMDALLHEEDGFALCSRIKEKYRLPVIFLTSLSEDEHLEQGFDCGGDDYIRKPYSMKELELRILARIQAYQSSAKPHKILSYPPLWIDLSAHVVEMRGRQISLTASEFDILALLANAPYKVFNISDIYQKIWKMPDIENAQTVQVHIAHLRKKLSHAYATHSYIQTVWGSGYKFCPGDSEHQ